MKILLAKAYTFCSPASRRTPFRVFTPNSHLSILTLALWCLGISCKPPLPVYFDTPIGTKVQGFDTSIAGNYIPLDDVIDKGTKEFSEKYDVKYDKILPKDTVFSLEANGTNMNYEDVKDIIGTKKDSGKVEFD